MMNEMRSEMRRGIDHQGMAQQMGKMGSGKFMQSSMVKTTKQGADGRPVEETYHNKASGAFGGGNRVTERHQMY